MVAVYDVNCADPSLVSRRSPSRNRNCACRLRRTVVDVAGHEQEVDLALDAQIDHRIKSFELGVLFPMRFSLDQRNRCVKSAQEWGGRQRYIGEIQSEIQRGGDTFVRKSRYPRGFPRPKRLRTQHPHG